MLHTSDGPSIGISSNFSLVCSSRGGFKTPADARLSWRSAASAEKSIANCAPVWASSMVPRITLPSSPTQMWTTREMYPPDAGDWESVVSSFNVCALFPLGPFRDVSPLSSLSSLCMYPLEISVPDTTQFPLKFRSMYIRRCQLLDQVLVEPPRLGGGS